jgi:hypothetical protein
MITIFEPNNQMEVLTPKGKACIWLVTEYGSHTEKIFTCIVKGTGEIWEFRPKDIKVKENITFGRVDEL